MATLGGFSISEHTATARPRSSAEFPRSGARTVFMMAIFISATVSAISAIASSRLVPAALSTLLGIPRTRYIWRTLASSIRFRFSVATRQNA